MKILAIERELPGTPATAFQPLLISEATKVWELYQQGVVRELYFNVEKHTAVLVLECDDLQAARQSLDQLPLVRSQLIDFELVPLAPYDGFARLFGSLLSD
jgi:muconolactone delta-isomerase